MFISQLQRLRLGSQRTSHRTLLGAGWLVGARLGTRAIDFAALLILARLLVPSDFGVVAIAMTLVQTTEAMLDLPVGQVLVRASQLTPTLMSTAFTLSLLRGAALGLLLLGLSFPFSLFYHDPRLAALVSFLALSPLLRSLGSPKMVTYAQAIDFRREVALDLTSKVVSVVVSGLIAFFTKSYWAIAFGTVCTPLIAVTGSYVFAPFAPRLTLCEWRSFAAFLGWSSAAQAVTAINWQSDRPILAMFVPAATLGTFSVANDLSLLPEQALVKPIYRPLLSGYVTTLNDPERLARAHLRASRMIVAAGTPLLVGLACLALPATRLLLGGKWLLAAPLVQWLALTLILPLFTAALGPLAVALNRADVFFRQSLVELALRIPLTVLLAWRFGVVGLIVARLFTGALNTSTSIYYVRRLTGLSVIDQLRAGARPVLAGVVMGVTLLALRPWVDASAGPALFFTCTVSTALGVAAYAALMLVLWSLAEGRTTVDRAFGSALSRLSGARR